MFKDDFTRTCFQRDVALTAEQRLRDRVKAFLATLPPSALNSPEGRDLQDILDARNTLQLYERHGKFTVA